MCSKFPGKHPCQGEISIKLLLKQHSNMRFSIGPEKNGDFLFLDIQIYKEYSKFVLPNLILPDFSSFIQLECKLGLL